jgi:acyl-coenzyme A thioesterase PaaI-like protein
MAEMPRHQLTMTVLMTPDMANFAGKVHGGTILKLFDEVAYACASRYAARYVDTVSVDQVTFRQPIHVGELVSFLASAIGRGSGLRRECAPRVRTARSRRQTRVNPLRERVRPLRPERLGVLSMAEAELLPPLGRMAARARHEGVRTQATVSNPRSTDSTSHH